ncbi:23S rRNA methyltransferase [Companilactobacillus sp. RD055328]|uniref:RsmF rRNA methyltransferase first C-terminal domain-containing protein n=1 Tax=Companilactobacillus sp. RD055328 TaxID=2916634 RepID=UPI001FC8B4D6|nr:RsmF rRNA methyltransferase first C-terminal domain-containing protein [Companilactobacillus sp. RD055328]GKQ42674.1 23S rRNA methyltransferase [Companilactobacillus sp. RD055328]
MVLKLPEKFINKYQKLLGTRYSKFEDALFQEAIEGFRLNPLKEDYQDVDQNLDNPITYSKIGFYGDINGNSVDHISGYLYGQDPSAMYVAEVLDVQPEETVLDLCAAPGSKSTYLASKMANKGVLVANEINTARSKILSSNIERMGITNTVVTNNSPEQLALNFPNYFDKIVVDAPCSGEGMFRKDHNATQYWSPEYVEQCATRQKDILSEAYKMLKPGGTIVYSTCTFAPEEDEMTALWFADVFNLKIENIEKFPGMEDGKPEWCDNDQRSLNFLRMFPDQFNGEGHFISKFTKNADDNLSSKTNPSVVSDSLDKSSEKLFNDFISDNLNISFSVLHQNRDNLEAPVLNTKDLNNIKVVRNGLRLGTFKKNRFEPNHALALALKRNEFKKVIELTNEQYLKFAHGEAIRINEQLSSSWVGVSYNKKTFSWGKFSNNTVKNFFPKGLRL